MTDSADKPNQTAGRRSKVERLIEEYGLEGVGAELEQSWTAPPEERQSLRDLAEFFNHQLLAQAMAEAGVQQFDDDHVNVYRLLTDEEVSHADRTRTRRRLEREGVDVDELLGDFVTYQAIRTYLTEYRDAEYSPADADRLQTEIKNLERLRGRTSAVTQSKLEELASADHIVLGDFRTFVEITVLCEDCGTKYSVDELLERDGCDCADVNI
ncbi:rod-determining factor RdfA [Halobacteriaceae archaeon SHR40]|uniref:rod-determining factor RdfA n=1 Tax=Halovenus amylolytica TaxID=2500550 RepID=UPI000FE31590